MELNIIYTKESERARLKFTFDNLDFYREQNHLLNLPSGIDVNDFNLQGAVLIADEDFPSKLVLEAKESILTGWEKYHDSIMQCFQSLTFVVPNSLGLILTQYGGGGSYNVDACEVTINVNFKADPLSILIHEITHILVDPGLVNKFDLNHEEKENLIKWLITNDQNLSKFIEVPTKSPINQPPRVVTEELRSRGYKSN